MTHVHHIGRASAAVGAALAALAAGAASDALASPPATQCAGLPAATTAVAFWSTEARCAIVPPTAGPENFGNKFPGEAAVYMGIAHVAIYDAAVATAGRGEPFGPVAFSAPHGASAAAAIATASYDTLSGLQPVLALASSGQATLAGDYTAYLAGVPDSPGKTAGIATGERVAEAVLAWRANDGLERNPVLADLNPPAPGPGVWQPNPAVPPATIAPPPLGLRLPGVRPLGLRSASQFRPQGPPALTSRRYARDVTEIEQLGAAVGSTRTPEQTTQALFWTDPDARQWDDGLLRLAASRGLGQVQTARMLAMAHVAGADAIIACFDAKYHYWSWRPYQAIAGFQPLGATPNHPEYPAAHACHTSAVVTALQAFFGTDRVAFSLDSRVTGTTRTFSRLSDAVGDVAFARILAGFHFRYSTDTGVRLGRRVARYDLRHGF